MDFLKNSELKPNTQSKIEQWFIFLNDKCEGPFNTAHIQQLLAEQILNSNDLIWCSHFVDWKPIAEVEPFSEQMSIPIQFGIDQMINENVSSRPHCAKLTNNETSEAKTPAFILSELADRLEEYKNQANNVRAENSLNVATSDKIELTDFFGKKILPESYKSNKSWSYTNDFAKIQPQFKNYRPSVWKSASTKTRRVLIKYNQRLIGVALAGALLWTSSQVYNYFKYPRINGVGREDIRAIYAAKRESLANFGPAFTLVMAKDNLGRNSFHGGTNLPEGSELQMHIEGLADTLIESFGVSVEAPLSLENGIVSSPIFIQENGKPYPTGEYKVTIKCHNCANYNQGNPILILAEKSFFIGGSKNNIYDQNLRLYHEKLRSQASTELIEIKQFADNFEQLLNETNMVFSRWHAGHLSVADWQKFHLRWQKFSSQILQITKDWHPNFIVKKYYYNQYYSLLKGLEALLVQVHNGQHEWVVNSKVSSEVGTSIFEKSSMIQSSLLMIRTKVALIEHLPTTANGMPPR